jgi:hypothetical protein
MDGIYSGRPGRSTDRDFFSHGLGDLRGNEVTRALYRAMPADRAERALKKSAWVSAPFV